MVFEKAFTMDTVGDFLKSIFYPPAWERGEAWTYEPPYESEFAPHREKYDPKLPRYLELYAVGHFLATLIIQQKFLTDFHVSQKYLNSNVIEMMQPLNLTFPPVICI